MLRLRIAVALLATGLAGAGPAAAVTLTETFDHTYAFPAGGRLAVENTNGSVDVETWDRGEVRVVGEKKVSAGGDSRARSLLAELRIEVEETPGGVAVRTVYPRQNDSFLGWLTGGGGGANVSYTIWVPARADLDLSTVNGHIEAAGVAGRADLDTTNGRITLREAKGQVHADTTNGGITVELSEVTAGADLVLSTTNGGIRLRIPRTVQASVEASTTNGSIETDLPIEVEGRLTRHSLSGTINGGGGAIRLSTTNGGITIEEW